MPCALLNNGWYYKHESVHGRSNPMYSFKHRAVADLAWACFSPPLLHSAQLPHSEDGVLNCALALTPQREQWLRALDADPAELLQHLAAARSRRLGLYFEQLWHFFLEVDPQVDLLANNLAVRDAHRTIGEFDCLYYCHQRQRHCHLELAVKYYLGYPAAANTTARSDLHEWLGPANKDRLDLKLSRLLSHQIRLAQHPAAQPALNRLGISSPLCEIEIKGSLFIPYRGSMPPPVAYNNAVPLQDWLPVSNLQQYKPDNAGSRYQILPKPDWLTGDGTTGVDKNTLMQQVSERINSHRRPQMVAVVDEHGTVVRRFFVTPDRWPLLPDEPGPPLRGN
tara:strand:+ start:135678 stop:136688 length:1011 start_codon:yes stop_codon:yes gene_type:complete